jgi:hypothetical protein
MSTETLGGPAPPRPAGTWRRVVVVVLLVLVGILAPLSVAGVWLRDQILDTQAYVDTVAPLSEDPAIQAAVASYVSTQIFASIDLESAARDALPPRAQLLVAPLAAQVRSFADGLVLKVVQSPQFSAVWTVINRAAHTQVVNFLLARPGAVSTQGDSLVLDLGPVVQSVQARLVSAGIDAAGRIPADRINRNYTIADISGLTKVQSQIRLFQGITVVLPFATVGLLGLAVLVAPNRRRTLLAGTLAIAAGLVVLAVGLNLARSAYLDALATRPNLSGDAAAAIFDTIVRFLRDSIRAVFTIAVVVALVAFLSGPATVSVRLRRRLRGLVGRMRDGLGAGGWENSAAAAWIGAHRQALRVASVALGALLLVFLERLTPVAVLAIAAGVVVLFVGIEVLGQRPRAHRLGG